MIQGTSEWFAARRGKITASKLQDVLGTDAQRLAYCKRLRAELAGETIEDPDNKAMAWGRAHEPQALASYELQRDVDVVEAGFIVHPDLDYVGGSPDGLIESDGGVEIKCPYNPERHLKTLLHGMPLWHKPQVQGLMWITGRAWWDYVSFDPRQPPHREIHIERIPRDEDYIEDLHRKVLEFWQWVISGDPIPEDKEPDEIPSLF